MISSLPVIAGAARFFIGSLTVNDLILLLVQIEQGVQLVQTSRFAMQRVSSFGMIYISEQPRII